MTSYQDIITLEPDKRSGKPCIRGLRITVYDVLEYFASGMTQDEILEDFDQWQVIREIGAHARVAVAQRGIKAFVSLVAPRRGKNGYRYILARRSKFIDGFPVGLMCDMLNKEEGLDPHSDTCWGGNRDNVIGSPRPKCGSTLPPERVIEIVKAACDEQARRRALDTPRP